MVLMMVAAFSVAICSLGLQFIVSARSPASHFLLPVRQDTERQNRTSLLHPVPQRKGGPWFSGFAQCHQLLPRAKKGLRALLGSLFVSGILFARRGLDEAGLWEARMLSCGSFQKKLARTERLSE